MMTPNWKRRCRCCVLIRPWTKPAIMSGPAPIPLAGCWIPCPTSLPAPRSSICARPWPRASPNAHPPLIHADPALIFADPALRLGGMSPMETRARKSMRWLHRAALGGFMQQSASGANGIHCKHNQGQPDQDETRPSHETHMLVENEQSKQKLHHRVEILQQTQLGQGQTCRRSTEK